MTDIIERLKEPETHYPGNFDTPKRANAMLSCLCQEAAEEIEHLRQQIADRSQPGGDHGLTVAQAAHVAKVDPNHRLEMADILRRGVAVGIDCCETDRSRLRYGQSYEFILRDGSIVQGVAHDSCVTTGALFGPARKDICWSKVAGFRNLPGHACRKVTGIRPAMTSTCLMNGVVHNA